MLNSQTLTPVYKCIHPTIKHFEVSKENEVREI